MEMLWELHTGGGIPTRCTRPKPLQCSLENGELYLRVKQRERKQTAVQCPCSYFLTPGYKHCLQDTLPVRWVPQVLSHTHRKLLKGRS